MINKDNIQIIRDEIIDESLLDSLEDLDNECGIESIELLSDDHIYNQIELSVIDENRKVIVVPYYCRNANAFTYVGEDTIYLLGSTPEKDEDIIEEDINRLSSCGYDTKEITWENRRIGVLVHEEGHIRTYQISNIKNIDDCVNKLNSIFKDYKKYVYKYLNLGSENCLDPKGLLEIIAEDYRINHSGRGSIFPHKYFYDLDIKDPKFKEERFNLLRKTGLI